MEKKSSATPSKICTLCKSSAYRVFEGMSGYVLDTKYDVYECSNCGSSFVDPMSNLKEEYDLIYGKENVKDAVYNYYYYVASGVKNLRNPLKVLSEYTAIYWGVLKAFRDNEIKEGAKILEVGSGLGYFTYALNKAGYEARGLEYSETATSFANEFFDNNYTQGTIEEYAKNNKEKYDVVVATEVIEHVESPESFIGAFLEVLKPGGKIIITTPNKDVHPKGTVWETDYAPKHLWWFTENGLKVIADHFGKSFSSVDFTEYKRSRLYNIPTGVPFKAPNMPAIVDIRGAMLNKGSHGNKQKLMQLLPASLYLRIVGLYHHLTFLRKSKIENGSMYILCAVITK